MTIQFESVAKSWTWGTKSLPWTESIGAERRQVRFGAFMIIIMTFYRINSSTVWVLLFTLAHHNREQNVPSLHSGSTYWPLVLDNHVQNGQFHYTGNTTHLILCSALWDNHVHSDQSRGNCSSFPWLSLLRGIPWQCDQSAGSDNIGLLLLLLHSSPWPNGLVFRTCSISQRPGHSYWMCSRGKYDRVLHICSSFDYCFHRHLNSSLKDDRSCHKNSRLVHLLVHLLVWDSLLKDVQSLNIGSRLSLQM